jgi:hypothetical protein
MIHDSEQKLNPFLAGSLPGLLASAEPELVTILTQAGTPELFRQGTTTPLPALGTGPLVVTQGTLSFARALVNGPTIVLATLVPGDILCPRALHPILQANAFLHADEDALAYTVVPGRLAALRTRCPDLAAALDRQINDLLRRLLTEAESLLRSFREYPD